MTKNNYYELVKILNIFAEIYNRQLSKITYQAYYEALKDMDIEAVKHNADYHLKTSKFFPAPADLRQQSAKDKRDGMLAWEKVIKALSRYGTGKSIQFDDPAIHTVIVLLGGWEQLGQTEEKNVKWVRKDFLDIYNIIKTKTNHPLYLVGRYERQNNARGFEYDSPIIIAEKIKKNKITEAKNREE